MPRIVTALEARVQPERVVELRAAYAEAGRGPFPAGLVRSALLQMSKDPEVWRIETEWESHDALMAMRGLPGEPRGVHIFGAAGAQPTLEIFETVDAFAAPGASR